MSHCSLCGGSGWEGRCDCDPDGQYHCRGMGTCGTHECPACGEEGFLTEPISLAKLALRFSRVERATFHEDGVRPETDSDHTVMLGLVACQLAPPLLDQGKVAQYSIVHDLVEAYSGDVQTLTITEEGRRDKERREGEARARILEEFGPRSWVCCTLMEYEEQVAPEARFVRLMDKILPKLTHAFNGCAAAQKLGVSREGFRQAHAAQHEKLSAEYPEFSVTLGLLRESMDYAESCWRDQ